MLTSFYPFLQKMSMNSAKMGTVLLRLVTLASLALVVAGNGDIYIVVMHGDPVVSYDGGIEGFSPTAVDLEEEFDVTRYTPSGFLSVFE